MKEPIPTHQLVKLTKVINRPIVDIIHSIRQLMVNGNASKQLMFDIDKLCVFALRNATQEEIGQLQPTFNDQFNSILQADGNEVQMLAVIEAMNKPNNNLIN